MIVNPPKIIFQDGWFLSFPLLTPDERREAQGIVGKWRECKRKISLALSIYRKPRSNEANAFMWKLCKSIADVVGSSKENVYKAHIRDFGEFTAVVVSDDALDKFLNGWGRNDGEKGVGWFCDTTNNYDGTHTVLCYYGSSTYDTKQMSVLIQSLIDECDDLGLDVQISDSVRGLLNDVC